MTKEGSGQARKVNLAFWMGFDDVTIKLTTPEERAALKAGHLRRGLENAKKLPRFDAQYASQSW